MSGFIEEELKIAFKYSFFKSIYEMKIQMAKRTKILKNIG